MSPPVSRSSCAAPTSTPCTENTARPQPCRLAPHAAMLGSMCTPRLSVVARAPGQIARSPLGGVVEASRLHEVFRTWLSSLDRGRCRPL
eukprot:9474979-Pyramimonas_sp.AAC.1